MSCVGDRHRDGAEVGGDLLFGPRQGHPFAPERIARPEMPLLPGHEGAAPQRAVGDDRRRHEQVLARIRPRGPGQAPARPKAPGDLQERAGALAARVLEARGLVDHQHVEQRMIIGKGGEFADQPGHKVDADHRHLALGRGGAAAPAGAPGFPSRTATRRCCRCGQDAISCGHTVVGDELRRDDQRVPALPVADQLGERRERGSALAGAERRDQKGGIALVQKRRGALLIRAQDAGERRVHLRAAFALV